MQLSKRIINVPPSATLALNSKAKALKAEGKDVINLTTGEPDFDTPRVAVDGAIEALNRGETRYSPVPGIMPLRQKLADSLSSLYQSTFTPEQIVVSNGAKQSLANILFATLDPGDEVIIPSPYWVSYPHMVTLAGGRPILCEYAAANNFILEPKNIEALISEKTKAIIINSPCNPTGAVQPSETLEELVHILAEKDVWVIYDDIYQHLTYDATTWTSPFTLNGTDAAKTIVVGGVSKSYAMTGFRIGWAVLPTNLAGAVTRLQGHITSGACTMSQWAALAALEHAEDDMKRMRDVFAERREIVIAGLQKIPNVKLSEIHGAFYAFPNFSAYLDDRFTDTNQLATYLLEEALVATVPGEAFGCPGHLRISFAADSDQLKEAFNRIGKALS